MNHDEFQILLISIPLIIFVIYIVILGVYAARKLNKLERKWEDFLKGERK